MFCCSDDAQFPVSAVAVPAEAQVAKVTTVLFHHRVVYLGKLLFEISVAM